MGVKIQLFEVGAYRSEFCLWGRMKSEFYKEKISTRDELVSRIMNIRSAALIKQERQDDLRRATRTVAKRVEKCIGFLNTYFELLQFIEIIYINKCNRQVICLPFVPFVRLFIRNIQTAVSPHPLKIGHLFI